MTDRKARVLILGAGTILAVLPIFPVFKTVHLGYMDLTTWLMLIGYWGMAPLAFLWAWHRSRTSASSHERQPTETTQER